jgi:NAD(P)-dependent dehydrogenase (short-subunit alcohol dehydrogenase family)
MDAIVDPHQDAGPLWLAGRVAIVTGGGLGGPEGSVGYAISLLFARHGARVTVLDLSADAAGVTVSEIAAGGGEAFAVVGDVTREEDCRRAVDETVARFGGLDTLVNNVASGDRAGLLDVTPERWDELIAITLKSAWLMTRAALPAITRGGAIVNISSVAAVRPGTGMVYSVAKAGVENMTRGLAGQLGTEGIRANCVQLGAIWTAMAARNLPGLRDQRRQTTALKTEGTSWDAAYAALFLASDRARWITGHVLTVDGGGLHLGKPAPDGARAARS